ncbi:MAG: NADH:ubiquinone oxidoreductase subunit RnfD [Firmicutes bacterium HGW-Firmicutes-10]|nr:MAG: NADH:ubiquinone oxidoreductase subunit RnfD [Firmicutes bacterium HGW-Firmicutes-10]
MKFTFRPSPNARDTQSTKGIMFELTLALLAVFVFALAFYYVEYGMSYVIHALGLMATSVLVAAIVEVLWCVFLKKDFKKHLSASFPWVTAIILVLMVPISTTYYAMAFGSFFAIFFAKLLFGGFGHNIFNPAAAGRAAMLTSFAAAVTVDMTTGPTPISSIANLGWIVTDQTVLGELLAQFGGLQGLLVGWYPGGIGETSALLIIVLGVYLAFRKVLDWRAPVFYVGTVFVLATVIALVRGLGIWYPLYHILAGGLLFGAVFMLTDPVTNPTSATGRMIFAIGCGIITMLIRVQANLPGGVLYSILIMNMFTPTIERLTDGWQIQKMKKYAISIASLSLTGILLFVFIANIMVPVVPKEPEPEVPVITLGDPIGIFSNATATATPELTNTVTDGNVVTYTVSSKGYAVLEGGYEGAKPNVFEVKIDTAENKIVSVKYITFSDTKGIGDKVDSDTFLDQFKGLSIDDESISVDSVSGATITSVSAARAVRFAIETLKKGG